MSYLDQEGVSGIFLSEIIIQATPGYASWELVKKNIQHSGETRLIWAVFYEAVGYLLKHYQEHVCNAAVKREIKDVEDWINNNDDAWPFSFINICRNLGLDPDYVRSGIARKKRVLSGLVPH